MIRWLVLCTLCVLYPNQVSAHDLVIRVEGIKTNQGQLMIALFDRASAFPTQPDLAYQKASVPITQLTESGKYVVQYHFKNLDEGDYALSVFHDENNNGIFDMFLVFPAEGYGISGNYRPILGPPRFEDNRFTIPLSDTQLNIQMMY